MICPACQDDEHDTCNNLFWEASCECRHTTWPPLRCHATITHWGGRTYVCEVPQGQHTENPWVIHKATYWHRSGDNGSWGWVKEPLHWWHHQTTGGPTHRMDPFDPTAPGVYDQSLKEAM